MNTENSLKLETKVKNLSRSIISKTIVRQNNEIVIKYQLQYGYIQCYFKRLNVMFTPGQTKTVYFLYGPTTDPSTEAISLIGYRDRPIGTIPIIIARRTGATILTVPDFNLIAP